MKKVILVGKGHGHWLAPKEKDEDTEVWGINDLVLQRTHVDLLFNMHDLDDYCILDTSSVHFADKMGIPIVMIKKYPQYPNSIEFPLKEAMEEFKTDYFMTGIAYMFAYAIMKGFERIDCYGINMKGEDEKYKNARACVEFWIGVAKGRGIEVNMFGKYTDCLKIFDRRLYGYNTLQTMPQDINDRAIYVNFGMGLHRKHLHALFKLLSLQKDGVYYEDLRPLPIEDRNNEILLGNLHEMIYKRGDGHKYTGDVGFYNIYHMDKLCNSEDNAKFICIQGDREEAVEDWMKFSGEANMWTNPEGEHWNGDKRSNLDVYFPKYNLPKKKAIEAFYDEYYNIAKRTEYKIPTRFRVFDASKLYTLEGQEEILSFAGYKKEDMKLLKEEVCQNSLEK
jgi:hypothetical protein